MVGRRHHHHHHGIGGAVGAGLLGLGLGLATAAVLTTPSRPTVTVSTPSCTFWHGCRPRWLPSNFVVSSSYHGNRSMWVNQAQNLFYQHTMGLSYLTKRTFKLAMRCLGVHKHQSKHLFFMMDTDRNGVITLDEFINAYLFVMSGGMSQCGFRGVSGMHYPTSFSLQPNQTVTVTTTQYQQPPTQSVTYQQVPTYTQPMYQPQPQQQTVTYQQNITYQQPQPSYNTYQPIPSQPSTSYYQPQPQVYNPIPQPQVYNPIPQPYGQQTSYPNMPPPQPFAQQQTTTTSMYQPPQPPVYQQPRYY